MLATIWQQIQLKDFVDILIVSILIYQVLSIVRGTRALQMLIGVGALAGLFGIGISYNLYALNWILNHFFDSFFIILIVLFQDEIRLALANFGSGGKVFGGFVDKESQLEIEEIIEACSDMSRKKVGGLIVFERQNGLLNYIASGTRIEGNIHSDLIYAIFQQSSPLHDGAIIISKGIIAAAGCFLPISKNLGLDKRLGTRHRAALGITEVTDAVAVVISEETGKISLCINGALYQINNEQYLRQHLVYLWTHGKLDMSFIQTIKEKNN